MLATGGRATPAHAPHVAVFAQAGFPSYMVSGLTSPRRVADALRKAGVQADLLDAAALADPARCSARTYAAVVLPYGNAYPQEAFANLRAFHRAGGALILSGVPFTHAVARQKDEKGAETWKDLGHNSAPALFGPDGIGVGGFTDAPEEPVTVAPGDPLGLRALGRDWSRTGQVQALDTATLPAGGQRDARS